MPTAQTCGFAFYFCGFICHFVSLRGGQYHLCTVMVATCDFQTANQFPLCITGSATMKQGARNASEPFCLWMTETSPGQSQEECNHAALPTSNRLHFLQ